MVDVLVRADRGKNDTSRMEDVDEIKVINSMLYQKQAKDNLDWRLLTKAHADGKIQRSTLKAQVKTMKWTDIRYQSQCHWYGSFTEMVNDLLKNNVGICKKT